MKDVLALSEAGDRATHTPSEQKATAAMNRSNFQLGARQSARLLGQAFEKQVTILVEPRTCDDATAFEAVPAGQSPDHFDVRLKDHQALASVELEGTCCDCRLVLGRAQYVFETYVVGCRRTDAGVMLSLARPESLAVLERRAHVRARLAESCDVHLRWGEPSDAHAVVATLLNLAAQGMACRVDDTTAADLSIGEQVEAALPVGRERELVELPAVVRNKTPGGSRGTWVLGLQFAQGRVSASAIDRLSRHLAAWQPSAAGTE